MSRTRRPAALAAGATAAILLAGGLSGCGALPAERCLPAPLTASPATVAPGGIVIVSSPAVDCDLGYGSDRTYTVGVSSEGTTDGGERVVTEGGEFTVAADGSFRRQVVVPAEMPGGPAYVSIRGSAFDECDDGESSCAAYTVTITVG